MQKPKVLRRRLNQLRIPSLKNKTNLLTASKHSGATALFILPLSPMPGCFYNFFQHRVLWLPVQYVSCFFGIGNQYFRIAGTGWGRNMRNRMRLVTDRTVSITFCTEYPLFVPRFNVRELPCVSIYFNAAMWAFAKSVTWM